MRSDDGVHKNRIKSELFQIIFSIKFEPNKFLTSRRDYSTLLPILTNKMDFIDIII